MRTTSTVALLRRCGAEHPTRVANLLQNEVFAGCFTEDAIYELVNAPDVDGACVLILRLLEALAVEKELYQNFILQIRDGIRTRSAQSRTLFKLLGTSQFFGNWVLTHLDALLEVWQINPTAISDLVMPADVLTAKNSLKVDTKLTSIEDDTQLELVESARLKNAEIIATDRDTIRNFYYSEIIKLVWVDLSNNEPTKLIEPITKRISEIVSVTLQRALEVAKIELLQAQEITIDQLAKIRFTVLGIGKLGAKELNYISDVDLMYVVDSVELSEQNTVELATKLGTQLQKVVETPGVQPALWPLDINLRPEGKDGPLVRTLQSYQQYYKRWAKNWEFQALLKAEWVAGDKAIAAELLHVLQPLVWQVSQHPDFVEETQKMRERVENISANSSSIRKRVSSGRHVFATSVRSGQSSIDKDRRLKLGRGGLRDVEFTVQLLQLVHGRSDENLRCKSTFAALRAISEGGYIARSDADRLLADYEFLRLLEHRLQLYRILRSHDLPSDEVALRRLSRAVGIGDAQSIEIQWRSTKREVRQIHLEMFYRPLLQQMSNLSNAELTLAPQAALDRLRAIGYCDPQGAIRHITALTEGISRGAKIQKNLLPVILEWFATGPRPDMGLLSFRILSEKMGATSWFMRIIRDSSLAAKRLAKIISTSSLVAEELPKMPQSVAWLDSEKEFAPREKPELLAIARAIVNRRRDNPAQAIMALRGLRRQEMLRCAMADILGTTDLATISESLSATVEAILEVGLQVEIDRYLTEHKLVQAPAQLAIIALGRLGGAELGYASDADLWFVYHSGTIHNAQLGESEVNSKVAEDAAKFAQEVAQNLLHDLGCLGEEIPLRIDLALRPEGKNGALVRSLSAYQQYFARWVAPWEKIAMLRARLVAGDERVGNALLKVVDQVRYDPQVSSETLLDLRRMKARVEQERLPKGVDKTRHLKLGPGGLADIEWMVQLWQLRYAATKNGLRTTKTLSALQVAAELGLCTPDEYEVLWHSWTLSARLRNAQTIVSGRIDGSQSDVLTAQMDQLEVISQILGRPVGHRAQLIEEHTRLARKAREIVEKYIYGVK